VMQDNPTVGGGKDHLDWTPIEKSGDASGSTNAGARTPSGGRAGDPNAVADRLCPHCGERLSWAAISSEAGTLSFTLCCDWPMEIIDNWETFEELPEPLQQVALQRWEQEQEEYRRKTDEMVRRFNAWRTKWRTRHAHLFKAEDPYAG